MGRRHILRLFIASVCVAALVVAGLLLILPGDSRAPAVLARLAVAASAGRLVLERVDGQLGGDVRLARVAWRDGPLVVEATAVVAALVPADLLRGRVHLRRLRAGHLRVALAAAGDGAAPRFALPFAVGQLAVRRLVVEHAGRTFQVDELQARLAGRGSRLEVARLAGSSGAIHLGGSATLDLAPAGRVALRGDLAPRQAGRTWPGGLAALHFAVEGPWSACRWQVEGRGDLAFTAAGEAGFVAAEPRVRGRVTLPRAALGPWQMRDLALDIEGTPADLRFDLGAAVEGVPGGAVAVDLAGRLQPDLAAGGAVGSLDYAGSLAGDGFAVPLGVQGELRWAAGVLHLEQSGDEALPLSVAADLRQGDGPARLMLHAHWPAFDLALGGRRFALEPGRLALEGTRRDARFSFAGGAREADLGPLSVYLRGQVEDDGLRLDQGVLGALDGAVSVHGRLAPGGGRAGDIDFAARGLDLGRWHPRLGGRLDADGHLALLREDDGGIAVAVELARLGGRWRDVALAGHGRGRYTAGTWQARPLVVQVGDNVLELAGELGPDLDLDVDLALPDPAALVPGARGRLTARGRIAGRTDAPALRFEVHGAGLDFADWQVERIDGTGDLDFGRAGPATAEVALRGLRHGAQGLARLDASLAGERDLHRLRFAVAGLDLGPLGAAAEVAATGGWRAGAWRGELTTVAMDLGRHGRWRAEAPAAVVVGRDEFTLAPLCLAGVASARACVDVPGWQPGTGRVTLAAHALPAVLLAPWLPSPWSVDGLLDGRLALRRDERAWRGTGEVSARDAVLTVPAVPAVEALPLRRLSARFDADRSGRRLTLEASAARRFRLSAALHEDSAGTLGGTLTLALPRLAWLGERWPELAGSSGRAEGRFTLAGHWPVPWIGGHLRLVEGSLRLPRAGTRVDALDVNVLRADRTGVAFDVDAGAGAGRLGIGGKHAWAADGTTRFDLSGNAFPLLRLPEVEADVTPDFTLAHGPRGYTLRGRLTLPRVAVRVPRLPQGAVEVSADEVVIGAAEEAPPPPAPALLRDLDANLDVVLGEDVTVQAAGLGATLGGGLRWTHGRGPGAGRGEGRVEIRKGAYEAYGQRLTIKRGQLVFAGAIDNPTLDIEAVRPDIEITAGVRVAGQLREPRFTLFSQPALGDGDILAYIMTGRAVADATAGEASLVARAALSLGAERAAMVTTQVQEAFGLDEFSVMPGKNAGETALAAGKRLTPKLSVRSEFNPFAQVWSFFANYKLTRSLSVEAESGLRQGADLIYSIDSDTLVPERW